MIDILKAAITVDGAGALDEVTAKPGFFRLRPPPRWEGLAKQTLSVGSQSDRMEILFDATLAEKEKNGRRIMRLDKHQCLMRLGHPVMRQAMATLSRHRHNLVKQRARLMVQMRRLLHQTMPGFADLFEDNKLYHKSIALPVALQFPSADAIRRAGVDGIEKHLRETKVRFQTRTIERIVAWAGTAAEPS